MDLEDMVNLGQGFYAFVKYINRWIVLPAFNFFDKMIGSYGLVIALLTIFIRLLTSPLVYTSYLSGAKMKALKPELDILKAKFKDDQQAFSMEQMKLFRSPALIHWGVVYQPYCRYLFSLHYIVSLIQVLR